MTAGNFAPEQEEQKSGPFGLSFTPQVQGILIGVVGLGIAGYVIYSLILPILAQRTELDAKITESENKKSQLEKQRLRKNTAEQKREASKDRRSKVTTFFASDDSMQTLVLDMNRIVDQLNAGITDPEEQARLTKFEPVLPKPPAGPTPAPASIEELSVVTDGTLGSGVNGKLRRLIFNVGFQGSFSQTQNFMRDLERLQSLILVKKLDTKLTEQNPTVEVGIKNGQLISLPSVKPRLDTTFEMQALLPLNPKPETKP